MSNRPDPERTIYLVDGTNNLYRAYYAIRGLSTSRGVPTNAVFGFTSMLRKLVRDHQPRYLAVAFDRAEPTFRHKAFADYKANRPETAPELVAQIPMVKRVCHVLGVACMELEGFEADDIIGTLADRAAKSGFSVVVVATDKDLLQLVSDRIQVYNPVTEAFLDADGVERTFGVRPERVLDVLALAGDASDNIPGVPGIGDKGARELVRRYGDVESILQSAGEVRSKRQREGLQLHADSARLSRDLATIRRNAPVSFDAEALRPVAVDPQAAHDLFQELEFAALAKEFATQDHPSATAVCEVITDERGLERLVAALRASGGFALNLERDHPEPMRAHLVGIALARPSGEPSYVPLAHRYLGAPAQVSEQDALALLRPLLEDTSMERIGHNIKSDLVLLRRIGIHCPAFAFDSMIAGYLLNASRGSQRLEEIARDTSGTELPAYDAVLGTGAKRVPLGQVEIGRVAPVLGARVAAVAALRGSLEEGLRRNDFMSLYRDMEMPLTSVLADMERMGVRIDTAFLAERAGDWEARLATLARDIQALAGREFNLNSPRQLGEVLFEDLKLKPGRRTQKTRSYSTSSEILEELADEHPLPRLVLEHRALQKLKSTYVDALPQMINPETGRVHTSFNQAVAATGRLSSSDPNLQNIPVRTELGRQIRRAFITEPGWILLSADYSQIELRILAHLCSDPALVAAFRAGEDIHRRTAAEVFGVMPELVTDEMRQRAKAVNFGIIYGMGPQRLARDQGISLKEAQAFIERYFDRLPGVKAYLDAAVAAIEKDARARTLFGRVRSFPEIRGTDRNARQQAIRAGVNAALQGTAADLIKMAMVTLARRLAESGDGTRMILQVHDELVLEVPEAKLPAMALLVREVMEGVHSLRVPLVVDISAGPNWLDMKPVPRSKD